jgi:hypothetical protein
MIVQLPTVDDCAMLELPTITQPEGDITPVTANDTLPFSIARSYFIYDVRTGAGRGGHAHRAIEQLIVAAMGSFSVVLDDGATRRPVALNRPDRGLHVPRMIWRELVDFSSGAICLVFASGLYDEQEYIRDHDAFLAVRRG